jgi:hypothetical protein
MQITDQHHFNFVVNVEIEGYLKRLELLLLATVPYLEYSFKLLKVIEANGCSCSNKQLSRL